MCADPRVMQFFPKFLTRLESDTAVAPFIGSWAWPSPTNWLPVTALL